MRSRSRGDAICRRGEVGVASTVLMPLLLSSGDGGGTEIEADRAEIEVGSTDARAGESGISGGEGESII